MQRELGQSQNLVQGLNLTPQMRRSLEILQKPTQELACYLRAELLRNPLLEEYSEADVLPPQNSDKKEDGDFDDFAEDYYVSDTSSGPNDAETRRKHDFAVNSAVDKISLEQYLLNEASLDAKDAETAKAFAFFCGLMDERGFIGADANVKAEAAGFSKASADAALNLLRHSDPAGIGAFDMRDSLMLQLERADKKNSTAYKIIERHYELLIKRRIADIAKAEGKSESEIEDAILQISKLHTSPAREFDAETQKYISTDVYFFKDEDGIWNVKVSDSDIPKIRINPQYRLLAATTPSDEVTNGKDAELKSYVKEKIREAKSVMEAVEQRRATLLKICLDIIKRQPEFFEHGISALKPMTMQETADAVGVHSSTVGRAVSDKYAATPFGLFPLRNFFGGGYSAEDGAGVASASVREKIRLLVDSENSADPLSDSKIAEELAAEGLSVARRTVAKYRDELGIAPKNLRKRF